MYKIYKRKDVCNILFADHSKQDIKFFFERSGLKKSQTNIL